MPLSIRPASDLFLKIHGRATISRTISQANASSTSLACQRVDALAQLQIAKEPERSRVTQCAHRARQDLSTVKYDCITDQLLAPRHARPHGVACLHGVTFAQTFDVFCTARSNVNYVYAGQHGGDEFFHAGVLYMRFRVWSGAFGGASAQSMGS